MVTREQLLAEWGDAVAALYGWPGSPTEEMVFRVIAAGDALVAALTGPPSPPVATCTCPQFGCPVHTFQPPVTAPAAMPDVESADDVCKRCGVTRAEAFHETEPGVFDAAICSDSYGHSWRRPTPAATLDALGDWFDGGGGAPPATEGT